MANVMNLKWWSQELTQVRVLWRQALPLHVLCLLCWGQSPGPRGWRGSGKVASGASCASLGYRCPAWGIGLGGILSLEATQSPSVKPPFSSLPVCDSPPLLKVCLGHCL